MKALFWIPKVGPLAFPDEVHTSFPSQSVKKSFLLRSRTIQTSVPSNSGQIRQYAQASAEMILSALQKKRGSASSRDAPLPILPIYDVNHFLVFESIRKWLEASQIHTARSPKSLGLRILK